MELPKELRSLVKHSVAILGRVIQRELGTISFQRIEAYADIGTAGAGTARIRSGGGAGTLVIVGATLVGSTSGAIVFQNLEVSCY